MSIFTFHAPSSLFFAHESVATSWRTSVASSPLKAGNRSRGAAACLRVVVVVAAAAAPLRVAPLRVDGAGAELRTSALPARVPAALR